MFRKEKREVPKDLYEILALFWGWIGLHKFFAGKKLAGTLYLLFSWTLIPFFLSLIDFIVGLFKRADSHGRIKL